MDLKQLNYFVTVADEGSITAGAKKLFLSQPPLSTQLRDLEEELGCTLFERGSRHITLTESGKTLYTYAKSILDLSRVAKEEVAAEAHPEKGIIRIGMVSSLVCDKALRWLHGFSVKYPDIDFEITEGNTYQLLDKLDAGALHYALIRTPYTKGKRESFSLAEDGMIAVCQENFIQNDKTPSLEELEKTPLIIYRRWEETLRKLFTERGLKPHIRILADDARTAVKSAQLGLGVAIVPKSATEAISPDSVCIHSIRDCDLTSSMEIVRISSRYLPACARLFWEYLQEVGNL